MRPKGRLFSSLQRRTWRWASVMAVGMAVATMGRDDAAAGEECAGSDELPDEAWREITVAEGSQGPRSYMFSAQRGRVTRNGKPRLRGHGGGQGQARQTRSVNHHMDKAAPGRW